MGVSSLMEKIFNLVLKKNLLNFFYFSKIADNDYRFLFIFSRPYMLKTYLFQKEQLQRSNDDHCNHFYHCIPAHKNSGDSMHLRHNNRIFLSFHCNESSSLVVQDLLR